MFVLSEDRPARVTLRVEVGELTAGRAVAFRVGGDVFGGHEVDVRGY